MILLVDVFIPIPSKENNLLFRYRNLTVTPQIYI